MPAFLLKMLGGTATKMFAAFATQEMLEWLLMRAAESLVKSTKTPHDDAFLAKFKSSYSRTKKNHGDAK